MFIGLLISAECGELLPIWGRSGKGENARRRSCQEDSWAQKNHAKVSEVADLLPAKTLDLQHLRSRQSFFFYTEVKVQKVQVCYLCSLECGINILQRAAINSFIISLLLNHL